MLVNFLLSYFVCHWFCFIFDFSVRFVRCKHRYSHLFLYTLLCHFLLRKALLVCTPTLKSQVVYNTSTAFPSPWYWVIIYTEKITQALWRVRAINIKIITLPSRLTGIFIPIWLRYLFNIELTDVPRPPYDLNPSITIEVRVAII